MVVRSIILVASFFALITYITYSFSPPLIVFFLVQPLYSLYVSVLFGVAMGYVQRMFKARIGFGSSLYVFLFQMASLIGYFLPFMIEGYQPTIFLIPSVLVSTGILLMVILFISDRRKSKNVSITVGM